MGRARRNGERNGRKKNDAIRGKVRNGKDKKTRHGKRRIRVNGKNKESKEKRD